jgi:exonuclease VII small subunit
LYKSDNESLKQQFNGSKQSIITKLATIDQESSKESEVAKFKQLINKLESEINSLKQDKLNLKETNIKADSDSHNKEIAKLLDLETINSDLLKKFNIQSIELESLKSKFEADCQKALIKTETLKSLISKLEANQHDLETSNSDLKVQVESFKILNSKIEVEKKSIKAVQHILNVEKDKIFDKTVEIFNDIDKYLDKEININEYELQKLNTIEILSLIFHLGMCVGFLYLLYNYPGLFSYIIIVYIVYYVNLYLFIK